MSNNISINIAKVYAMQIRAGMKELKDVPAKYRTYVKLLLEGK